MRKFEITTKYKNSGVEIPKRATKSSAGYDSKRWGYSN